MRETSMIPRPLTAALAALTLGPAPAAAEPDPPGRWSWAVQAGAMTDGRAEDMLVPGRAALVGDHLAGIVLGYDRRIGAGGLSWGAELQANLHSGDDPLAEIVLPLSLRYRPEREWFGAVGSVAFGLGYSVYSDEARVELDLYGGQARRGLVYWYLEAETSEVAPGRTLFVRLHHRSDGFGTLSPEGGSNAWVAGFRREF
jgi:hypothetical protein